MKAINMHMREKDMIRPPHMIKLIPEQKGFLTYKYGPFKSKCFDGVNIAESVPWIDNKKRAVEIMNEAPTNTIISPIIETKLRQIESNPMP
mmetsp:Transcript_18770/g.24781  ORF Transcript_18770/g.24781 Transcript_18770/m.24781 type:complete len:91 (-) Transcript_18770:192-464(-)